MKNLLTVSNLSVSYGMIKALKNVNINVPEGQIVAILGANGGGKTSLLRKISGLIPATEGTVTFNDINITDKAAEKITNMGIVQSPEGRQIFGDISVEENLMIGAFTLNKMTLNKDEINEMAKTPRVLKLIEQGNEVIHLNRKESILHNLDWIYTMFPVLKERKNQLAVTLSGGEQQMLAISRALMANPKLLILDEPSLGLAPLIVKNIFEIVKKIKETGTTILIVEQNALQTLKIADYAYVLQVGEVIIDGEAKKLLKDPKLIEAYLGE